jgi:hypothetical protein
MEESFCQTPFRPSLMLEGFHEHLVEIYDGCCNFFPIQNITVLSCKVEDRKAEAENKREAYEKMNKISVEWIYHDPFYFVGVTNSPSTVVEAIFFSRLEETIVK